MIVANRDELMSVDHSDYGMFIHGFRTLIASWDPNDPAARRVDT